MRQRIGFYPRVRVDAKGSAVVSHAGAVVLILRRERPRPGGQLRLTDIDGHRRTAFATRFGTT